MQDIIYEEFITLPESWHNGTEFHPGQPGSCDHYLSKRLENNPNVLCPLIFTDNIYLPFTYQGINNLTQAYGLSPMTFPLMLKKIIFNKQAEKHGI